MTAGNPLPSRGPEPRHERPERFSVEIRPSRDRVVVAPKGELDLATVGALAGELDRLVSRGVGSIVLDLRGLTFIDSTGLRLVIAQTGRPEATWGVIDGPPPVSRIFDLAGVRSRLPFVADV